MTGRAAAYALIGLMVVIGLAGCIATNPLAIPDDEWQLMTAEQRLQARIKQAELDDARAQARAEAAAAQQQADAQAAAQLKQQQADARYGDRLQCVLSEAQARLNRKWRDLEPLALDLLKDQPVQLTLSEASDSWRRYSTTAEARFDGQTLSLCPTSAITRINPHDCLLVLGTFEDYRQGIERAAAQSDFVRGHLRCALAPTADMPQRIYLERR